jgi:hypothetical protein
MMSSRYCKVLKHLNFHVYRQCRCDPIQSYGQHFCYLALWQSRNVLIQMHKIDIQVRATMRFFRIYTKDDEGFQSRRAVERKCIC